MGVINFSRLRFRYPYNVRKVDAGRLSTLSTEKNKRKQALIRLFLDIKKRLTAAAAQFLVAPIVALT